MESNTRNLIKLKKSRVRKIHKYQKSIFYLIYKILNMKKILVLFAISLYAISGLQAQKAKVVTAWNYYKYDELDKAREAINEASANETTSGSAKTWYYRGLIYQKMYKHEKFGNLDSNALMIAYDSYKKALELDPDYEFKEEITQNKQVIANQIFGKGVENFNSKKFDAALADFENVLKIAPNDTLATLNAAYSAEKSGNKAKAKDYYSKLIDMKYKDPRIYIFLGGVYKSMGDTAQALATVQKGRQAFPSENILVIEELNMYLFSGKDKEALEALRLAIQAEPKNEKLYFAQGTVYDKLNRKDEAATSYKKAIELKPDYFDAYYNLGAMYFNEAAEMANKANEMKNITEYGKAKEKFDAKFKEAQPYLEKAWELNPKDENTMTSLKQLYVRLNENEKYEKVKAALDNNK
jgi:tetratricopeptide (TPR) repeat protein